MGRMAHSMVILAAAAAAQGFAAESRAQEFGESVLVRETPGDLYAAGGEVDVLGPVNGDAVLAGGSVSMSGNVRDDLIAAGGEVDFKGSVGDDARLAGGSVTVDGTVAGHAVVAGGEVELSPASQIGEWAWLSGGELTVAGRIGGELKAMAGSIELLGQVGGNAELAGEEIRILDGAVVQGDLIWRSDSEPEVSEGAVIEGELRKGEPVSDLSGDPGPLGSVFVMLSLIVAAGVLFWSLRPVFEGCATTSRDRPWIVLLTGVVVFAATPVAIAVLFVTAIGWLLALVLLATYVLALLLGGLTGLIVVARLGLARFDSDPKPSVAKTWLAIAIAALALTLLYLIPPVGILAGTVLLFVGLGSLAREGYARWPVSPSRPSS